jgi:tetratricopeptide (TPR) repeat protein
VSRSMISLLFILLTAASPVALRAQGNGVAPTGTGGSHVIQGQVYGPSGRRAENVHVRLQSFGAGDLSVMSSGNGEFTFRALAPGNYTVSVDGGKDYESAEEHVVIDTDAKSAASSRPHIVVIHLQPKHNSESDQKPRTVNVAVLADVPEAARKLYEQAVSFSRAGNSKKAIENLNSAITIFPNFIAAIDQLGVEYLKLAQPDKAVEALTAALKLNPDDFRTNLNLGIALLETKQFAAAETQLRGALNRNAESPVAHMYLGLALLSEKNLVEAQTELARAASSKNEQVAKAHYYLGGIYWGNREYERAADELETYLKLVPRAPDAEKIRGTIKELRSKQ